MKNFVTLILVLCSLVSIAQVPTFNQFLFYRNNSIDELEEALSAKGWRLIETIKATKTD